MLSPNIMMCEGCRHLKYVGELMIGGSEGSGGPEDFYICRKGRDIDYYFYYRRNHDCPDRVE